MDIQSIFSSALETCRNRPLIAYMILRGFITEMVLGSKKNQESVYLLVVLLKSVLKPFDYIEIGIKRASKNQNQTNLIFNFEKKQWPQRTNHDIEILYILGSLFRFCEVKKMDVRFWVELEKNHQYRLTKLEQFTELMVKKEVPKRAAIVIHF